MGKVFAAMAFGRELAGPKPTPNGVHRFRCRRATSLSPLSLFLSPERYEGKGKERGKAVALSTRRKATRRAIRGADEEDAFALEGGDTERKSAREQSGLCGAFSRA